MTDVEPSVVDRQPPGQRRWFRSRYSLRALCVVFMVLSIGFGAVSSLFREASQQQAAESAVRRLGGHTFSTERYAFRPPEWILDRLGWDLFFTVFKVEIDSSMFGDKELAELSRHLAAFPDLESLKIRNSPITDSGLRSLTSLPPTTGLSIFFCPISDDGVKHLIHFNGSQEMWLIGTNISEAGAACLAEESPDCTILFDADGKIGRDQLDDHYKRRGPNRGT
jgi:hypothetical protein